MAHVIAAALTAVFAALNFWLWSLGQTPLWLLWEALGVAAVAFPALFLYVTRSAK
jgi:hypothetical protein